MLEAREVRGAIATVEGGPARIAMILLGVLMDAKDGIL